MRWNPIKRRYKNQDEHALQRQAIQWLNLALVPPSFAWSCDAAGNFGKIGGAMRKARGIRAGQPDIWVLAPGPKLVGVELKSATGRASNAQLEFADDCSQCGVPVFTCRSVDHIEQVLRLAGIPLRATLAPEPAQVKAARGIS